MNESPKSTELTNEERKTILKVLKEYPPQQHATVVYGAVYKMMRISDDEIPGDG